MIEAILRFFKMQKKSLFTGKTQIKCHITKWNDSSSH